MAEGRDGGRTGQDRRHQDQQDQDQDENEAEEASRPPDIAMGPSYQARECSAPPGCERENPFSFKHFLSSLGSRPARPGYSPPGSPPRLHHESTSGLPDFVQDHLVIEQCYLNPPSQQPMPVDLDNLPHFPGQEGYVGEGYGRGGGADTSLPDFLSDAPLRAERRDSDSPSSPPNRHSPRYQIENERLRLENDRLRREVDVLRRQLNDHITREESLEAELGAVRGRVGADSVHLAEDNLHRATKRALNAEAKVEQLKHEVQSLRNRVEAMRCREGTASTSALQSDSERLASQLRNAANTAELSLRNLLIGVDNLRLLAASLESPAPRGGRDSSDDSRDEPDESSPNL